MKKGLGRGLSALISEDSVNSLNYTDTEDKIIEIDINKIQLDTTQPRKTFDEDKIIELAESIKTVGVINPIIVNEIGEFYEIIAGERRFRALKYLKFKKVPAIIKKYDNIKKLEVSLIENIQRENLNPIEEALTYKRLQEEFGLNQEEIAEKIGKKRTTVTNFIRLLKLDKRVQDLLIQGKITNGHAKAILQIEDLDKQYAFAKKISEENLNVRKAEELAKQFLNQNTKDENKDEIDYIKDAKKEIFANISNQLNQILGTKVNIKDKNNKGKIEIEYYSQEQLDSLICLFKKI